MKLLKEEAKKEALPIEFITTFVSKGWDEVGSLKANIDGIQETFKDVEQVKNILQDLSDAYLICIGRLEDYLNKKDYVDIPEVDEVKAEETVEDPAETEEIEFEEEPIKPIEVKDTTDEIKFAEEPVKPIEAEEEQDAELEIDEIPEDEEDDFDLDFDDAEVDAEDESRRREWLNK